MFRLYGKDYETIATYTAAIWNAVDLRFRQMSNPAVRLNIAGLVVPEVCNFHRIRSSTDAMND